MASVVLRRLTKRFGSAVAVDGVDLQIPHGELVTLLGPSGCGKTTTLRLLAGFLSPDDGEIVVGDRTISSPRGTVPPARRNMSMIFQSYAVWPHMTVYQNVAYGLRLRKVSANEERRRVMEMLGVVKLEALGERYPGELSGGQQQRVALARALVVQPEILLLDEPLSNLDATLREEMRFEIRRLHDQFRITTIYVTHDQAEAMVISDRVAVMNRGQVEQIGTAREIYERPRSQFVAAFIGQTNALAGVLKEPGVVQLAEGILVRTTTGAPGLSVGAAVTVCVRPHEISMQARQEDANGSTNLYQGVVSRHTYLGNCQDYQVELASGGISVRVVTSPTQEHAVGETVYVLIPPHACRLLTA